MKAAGFNALPLGLRRISDPEGLTGNDFSLGSERAKHRREAPDRDVDRRRRHHSHQPVNRPVFENRAPKFFPTTGQEPHRRQPRQSTDVCRSPRESGVGARRRSHSSREDLLHPWNPYPLIERSCRTQAPAGHATYAAGTALVTRCKLSLRRSTWCRPIRCRGSLSREGYGRSSRRSRLPAEPT